MDRENPKNVEQLLAGQKARLAQGILSTLEQQRQELSALDERDVEPVRDKAWEEKTRREVSDLLEGRMPPGLEDFDEEFDKRMEIEGRVMEGYKEKIKKMIVDAVLVFVQDPDLTWDAFTFGGQDRWRVKLNEEVSIELTLGSGIGQERETKSVSAFLSLFDKDTNEWKTHALHSLGAYVLPDGKVEGDVGVADLMKKIEGASPAS